MQPKRLLEVIFIFLFVFNVQISKSQESEDLKSIYLEAESYFLYEEYNEALGLYQQLIRRMPENANINYKLGRCFLADPFKKELSIPYLEKASKNVGEKYKVKSFKEVKAPLEVYFYLGDAYRVTNQFDKAIETYTYFLGVIDEEIYDKQLVEDQIEACKRAKEQMKTPVFFAVKNFGEGINTNRQQSNAVLSGDGKQLAFVTKLPFYDAIFYTEKEGGSWKEPRNLTPEIKVDGGTYPTCMSFDGKEMYLYKLDGYNGNLYVTRLENGKWTEPVELKGLNTKYWESHASISKDKQTLYFSSNRPGGYGDLDIYVSKRISDFEWGEPRNLGATVNSRYNDDTPFITEDGKSLYFSSLGHSTIGGYDIFVSDFNNSEWSEPTNLGYPINTTSDELFFVPNKKGISGYMSMFRKDGFGMNDIYEIEIFSDLNPRKIGLKGKIKNAEGIDLDNLIVTVFDKSTNKKISETTVDGEGNFELTGQSGDIVLKINGRGITDYSDELSLSHGYDKESFLMEPQLEKSGLFAKQITKEEIITPSLEFDLDVIEITEGEEAEIRFRTDRGVNVEVQTTQDGLVYFEDDFVAKRRRNTINFEPKTGRSTVTIKITDENGNSIQKEIVVVASSKETENTNKEKAQVSDDLRTTREADFEVILKDLISISEGKMQEALNNMVDDDQISSLNDLISKLYAKTDNQNFTKEDIDALLAKYANQLAESYNVTKLKSASTDKLAAIFSQILIADNNILTTASLLDKYFELYADFDKENLLPVLVNLAIAKTNDFEMLNHLLSSVLARFNVDETTRKYESESYTEENVYNYFSELVNGENAKEIYKSILDKLLLKNFIEEAYNKSNGDLKNVLGKLLNGENSLNTTKELVNYLFEQSLTHDFEIEDVIKLFFELTKSINDEDIDLVAEEKSQASEISKNNNKQLFWFAGGSIVLIIWLILFIRRKKNKDTE